MTTFLLIWALLATACAAFYSDKATRYSRALDTFRLFYQAGKELDDSTE